MLFAPCRSLASALRTIRVAPCFFAGRCLHTSWPRLSVDRSGSAKEPLNSLDPALLDFLVCPLSKKPLRYEASTNELINEELGIAYPVIDGIPNMIPQAARMIRQNEKKEETEQP
ncbi:protein preY, mitochondrial [Rhynchocyon petersi]